jgi:hypothetical protein
MSAALGRRLERAHKKDVPEPEPDMTGWTDMERFTWEFKRYGLEEMHRRERELLEEEEDEQPDEPALAQPAEEIAVAPSPLEPLPSELPSPIPEPAPEPAPPIDPDAERRQAWIDEHAWWRERRAEDYVWDEPRARRLDDYDPFDDDSLDC